MKRKWLGRGAVLVALVLLVIGVTAGAAFAGSDPKPVFKGPAVAPSDVAVSLNLLWIVIGAVLVIFMQAGFAMVETGFCRAKSAAHVVSTNFMIFGLGMVGFFLVGYAFMFGGYSFPGLFGLDKPVGDALIGSGHWVFLWKGGFALTDLGGIGKNAALGAPTAAFFLYMYAFMDTTATIPTGAMAERWKWKSFVAWGVFCGAIYFPLFGAWTWGGGWLSQLGNSMNLGFGYVDFAGSGVVHAMGGVAGLAGILVLGARRGKYGPDGKPRTLAAHNIPMALLGTFILLFGWFGFNAASTLAATDVRFAMVATNTAISAGFVEKRGIDDPVGAVSVHGTAGIWGVLSIGLFASGDYGASWNLTTSSLTKGTGVTGLFYSWDLGIRQLGAQAIGSLVIIFVMGGVAYAFFKISDAIMKGGIRPTPEVEDQGLDRPEMGVLAYGDFSTSELVLAGEEPHEDKVLASTTSPDPTIGR